MVIHNLPAPSPPTSFSQRKSSGATLGVLTAALAAGCQPADEGMSHAQPTSANQAIRFAPPLRPHSNPGSCRRINRRSHTSLPGTRVRKIDIVNNTCQKAALFFPPIQLHYEALGGKSQLRVEVELLIMDCQAITAPPGQIPGNH